MSTTSVEKLAYSVPEVAEMLGVSRASAYNYVRMSVAMSKSSLVAKKSPRGGEE